MKYLSVCSGIEAATNAWHKLGWTPVGFSEIEPFPAAVLKHRFPNIPNYGDLTQYKSWPIEPGSIDLLVGGTPCQSFSVAGLRKGLADPRGNLCLTFLGLADHLRPRWILWENVVGVLSSGGGRDFGAFLGALGQLGYGWSYRVLNAEHFGVPQRRRRVFVLAYRDPVTGTGDWRVAAEALSVGEGLQRYLAQGKSTRKKPSADAPAGAGEDGCVGAGGQRAFGTRGNPGVANTLETTCHDYSRADGFTTIVQPSPLMFKIRGGSPTETGEQGGTPGKVAGKGFLGSEDKAFTIATSQDQWLAQPVVAPTVTTCKGSQGGSSNEAIQEIIAVHLAQQQAAAIPIQDGREIEKKQNGLGVGQPGDPAYTVDTTGAQGVAQPFIVQASELRLAGKITEQQVCPTLKAGTKGGDTEPLAVHQKGHWEGGDVHPTLNQSAKGCGSPGYSNQEIFSQGGAGLVPAVPFRKSKRAQSETDDETWVADEKANTLNCFDQGDTRTTHAVVQPKAFSMREDATNNTFHAKEVDVALCIQALRPAVTSHHAQNFVVEPKLYENHPNDSRVTGPHDVAPTVVSRFGTGGGNVPLVNNEPVSFQPGNLVRRGGADPSTKVFPTLTKDSGDQSPHVVAPVHFDTYNQTVSPISFTLSCAASDANHVGTVFQQTEMVVRRLSVNECLRLQGFPDNWTNIPWKGKPEGQAPDGPQYKCAGNSMAVPCMAWIGEGIARVEAKLKAKG